MSSELFRVLSNYFYHLFMVRTQPTLGEMTSFCYNIINQKITVSFGFMGGGVQQHREPSASREAASNIRSAR